MWYNIFTKIVRLYAIQLPLFTRECTNLLIVTALDQTLTTDTHLV